METVSMKTVLNNFNCNIYNHGCLLDKNLNYSTHKRKGVDLLFKKTPF